MFHYEILEAAKSKAKSMPREDALAELAGLSFMVSLSGALLIIAFALLGLPVLFRVFALGSFFFPFTFSLSMLFLSIVHREKKTHSLALDDKEDLENIEDFSDSFFR